MFLQKKNESAPSAIPGDGGNYKARTAANPLMQHYLKRKREAIEQDSQHSQSTPKHVHKKKKSAQFIQSESQLSSMLFHGSEGLLQEMEQSVSSSALGNILHGAKASSTKRCCWKKSSNHASSHTSHNLISSIPQNSIQFKALTQYMNKNELTTLTQDDYENAMRELYQKQHPTPQWIIDARETAQNDPSSSSSSGRSIFSSTKSLLSKSSLSYTGANLSFAEKVKINAELFAGTIQNVDTSPHSDILSILSGKHTIQLLQFSSTPSTSQDNFPLIDTIPSRVPLISAHFHRDQKHMLLMKQKKSQIYAQQVDLLDLQTGKRSVLRLLDESRKDEYNEADRFFSTYGCATSTSHPHSSDYYAFGDESSHGHIALFGTNSVFPDHIFHSGAPVTSLSFSADNRYMFSSHANAQVKVWDIRQRRPLLTHWDDGATDTTVVSCDSSTTNIHYSTGSSNGVVNVYSLNEVATGAESSTKVFRPKAKKAISNLVTPISTLKYNSSPDGSTSLLALASHEAESAFRLANPQNSYKVFANFPSAPDHAMKYNVRSMAFSARGNQLFVAYKGFVNMYSMT